MAIKSLSKSIAIGFIFLNTVLAFQNCSRNNFEFQSADLGSNIGKESVNPYSPFLLISNTATKPFICQSSNQVDLKIELNRNYNYECSDISYKNPSLKAGLTCTSGVEIPNSIHTNTAWVSCSNVSICGVQPSAVKQVNGSSADHIAFELTYKNLPWGCNGLIQSRFISLIDENSSALNAEINININPPSCKTCSNSLITCGECPTPNPNNSSCTFNGQTVPHGSSVTAYQSSSVPIGGTCTSQSRTCNNGTLSGSYTASSCTVESVRSCTFNGQTVPHGSSVTAYQSSSVPIGGTCASQSRTCNNGILSGSYTASSCTVESVRSCTFNGQTVPHGSSVTAYQSSSVPIGGTCASQSRTCNNDTLSGSYTASTCAVESAKACTTPWGTTIAHGATVSGYTNSSIAEPGSCDTLKASLTCYNGQTSGAARVPSCSQSPYVCPIRGSVQAWGGTMTPTDINGLKGYVKGVGYCLYQGSMGGDPYCSVYNFSGNYVNAGKYCNDPFKISKFKVALYNWDSRNALSLPCDSYEKPVLDGSEAKCYRGFVPVNVIVNRKVNVSTVCTGEKSNNCQNYESTVIESVTWDCSDGEQAFKCTQTPREEKENGKGGR